MVNEVFHPRRIAPTKFKTFLMMLIEGKVCDIIFLDHASNDALEQLCP